MWPPWHRPLLREVPAWSLELNMLVVFHKLRASEPNACFPSDFCTTTRLFYSSLLEMTKNTRQFFTAFFKQQSMQQWYYILSQFNVTQCTILKSNRFIFLRDTTCVFDRWSSHFWHKVGQSWESFETSNWSIYQWELMMVNPFVCCLCNEHLECPTSYKKVWNEKITLCVNYI